MTSIRCFLLCLLAVAFCTGCSDSSSQPSGGKLTKSDDVVSNDTTTDPSEDSHGKEASDGIANPHGANPHAGMETSGASAPLENDGKLDLEPLHWIVPKSWIRKSPSTMLLAEYAIPKTEGDKENGRLTVMQAGGAVESNVDRWKGQFSKLDKPNEETIDVEKVKVTIVDLSGTFEGMPGSGGSHADYRMIGAIAEVPDDKGMFFIKCYGPAKTMAARADELKAFIRSMKVDK